MKSPIIPFALLALACSPFAAAHHILGVPHYNYDEAYPQTPVLSYAVSTNDYAVKVTGNPGKPEPGERCSYHVYVQRESTGNIFDGKVSMEVQRERFMRTPETVYGPMEAELEEAIFKFYPTLDTVGNYTVTLRFAGSAHAADWSIILPVQAGEPRTPAETWGIPIGIALFAALLLRAGWIKWRRSSQRKNHSPSEPSRRPASGIETSSA